MPMNHDPHSLDLRSLPTPAVDFSACAHRDGAQLVLEVAGELDLASAPLLHTAAEQLWPQLVLGPDLSRPEPVLALDCTGLRFVDLRGLRALEDLNRRATTIGATMRVGGLNEFTRRLLQLCGLSPAWAVTEHQLPLTQG